MDITDKSKDIRSIACFGDSISVGRPGVSYLSFLTYKKRYLNYGVGGDTLLGVSKRIDQFLQRDTSTSIILEIGTNDLLLPLLRKKSSRWNGLITSRGYPITSNVKEFQREYKKLFEKLIGRKLRVISIPCLGETFHHGLNELVEEYNLRIKTLCEEFGIPYIDFYKWQKDSISCNHGGSSYFMGDPLQVILDSVLTTFLGYSNWISKRRGLIVTVDGVHLNGKGAKGLAHLMEEVLLKEIE